MVILKVNELLEKQGKSKYWLFNELNNLGNISYTNFNNMLENRTKSIKYENIDKLCTILHCEVGELFKIVDE